MPLPAPAQAHPGNDYYVNGITNTIQRQANPLLAAALKTSGWLGPYTWAEAKSVANSPGLTIPVPGMPGSENVTVPTSGVGISNPLGGVAAIGDFFNRLTQPNTWIRVGEVLAGLVLIWIGLNALTKDTAVGRGIQSAKRGAERTAGLIGAVPK
jgi:hypothetical protein